MAIDAMAAAASAERASYRSASSPRSTPDASEAPEGHRMQCGLRREQPQQYRRGAVRPHARG
jgi:hypothetical protein